MHVYAFGSVCRGEIDKYSDIDILLLKQTLVQQEHPAEFSVYSYEQLEKMWSDGNPFAWHLSFESKLLFCDDGVDFIKLLGLPSRYSNMSEDCDKFFQLFKKATHELTVSQINYTFELSNVYLSIRNFATCFALGYLDKKEFSRDSPRKLYEYSLQISDQTFSILKRARFLNTRGIGDAINYVELDLLRNEIEGVRIWMNRLKQLIDNG